jgi:hypothetical protein
MIDVERRVVARGVWLYHGTVPIRVEIYARPARFAGSRFKEADEDTPPELCTRDGFVFDQNSPIPDTLDGFVYSVSVGSGGEFHTIEAAKRWADAQPWGPVNWYGR